LKLRTITDFEDLIIGAKILGCGGGGEESLARVRVKEILEQGYNVKIIQPKDIPNEALICVSGMVGGRCTPECLINVHGYPETDLWPMYTATKELELFLDENLHSLVSTEIGAGNFLVPILVSARLGINVIDGDLCGRAKPEISISTSNILGIPITPLSIASAYGDKLILKTTQTDQRAEQIAREIAVLSGGAVGVARCPARWERYEKAVIPHTMSKAQNLGRAIRNARETGNNPIKIISEQINGRELFNGFVKSFEITDMGGFVIGTIIIENTKKELFKIWFKNEYLVSWLRNKPYITSPDLICVVDQETGEGLTPWANDFSLNRAVSVIGAANAPIWYTTKGLEIFGPKHFDFDIKFQSFNDFMENK